MSDERLWRVTVRGRLSDDAIGRLSAAGINRKGGSEVSSGGPGVQETHGLYLRADSAGAAAEKVTAAPAGAPVYIAADETRRIEE
jgi:hypothetical protein